MSGTVRSSGASSLASPHVFLALGVSTGVYCIYVLAAPVGVAVRGIDDWLLKTALLGVPAVGHCFVGYWLHTGGFDEREVWRIGYTATGSGLAGVTVAVAALSAVVAGSIPLETGLLLLVAVGTEAALIGVVLAVVHIEGLYRVATASQAIPTVDHGPSITPGDEGGPEAAVGSEHVTDSEAESDFETGSETRGTPMESTDSTRVKQLEMLHSLIRHDVRNHLTVVGGHLDMLADEAENIDEHHLETIEAQNTAILNLLEEVELAVEVLADDTSIDSVEVASVVQENVEILTRSHETVSVDTDVPSDIFVRGNDLLAAVFGNVLSNAVEHHDRESVNAEITTEVDGERVRIHVADDGPGIPDRDKPSVFDAEYGDGSGMGLYLVDVLVDTYGGEVSVDDNEPRGTIVSITLPRAD